MARARPKESNDKRPAMRQLTTFSLFSGICRAGRKRRYGYIAAFSVCALASATSALWKATPAIAVAIVQLPFPSTSEPANLVFTWSGGTIISGGPTYAYERVTVQPFALTPGPRGAEVVAATEGQNGIPWYVSMVKPETHVLPTLDELAPSGPVVHDTYPAGSDIPRAIALGADGDFWLAEGNSIERYKPGGGLESFPVNAPIDMVAGPEGDVWFTDLEGSTVGRIDTKGEVTIYPLSGADNVFETPAGPLGIVVGADGALWVAEQAAGRIARLTPSGELREFSIPTPPSTGFPSGLEWRAEPRYLALGAEGDIWFTDPGTESVGRVTPAGEVTEYRIPPAPKGDYRAGAEGYLVPNHIAAVPGGLLFSESDAKALGFIEPAASPPIEANSTVAAATRISRVNHRQTCVGDKHKHRARRATKAVCRRSLHGG